MPFDYYAIRVHLAKTNQTILVTIRHDRAPETHRVVFADPQKLWPYAEEVNSREAPEYLEGKHAQAREGLLAARQLSSDLNPIPGPDDYPLPMASVNCWGTRPDGKPNVTFNDGVTRTTEMILQGAKFVPLEVNAEEADLLHRAIGGELPPKPADDYIAPPDIRMERMIAYSQHVRRNPRI